MEKEKLLKYKGTAPIRFLNDFNAGLLTAGEYKIIREINKNNAWDEIDNYIAESVDREVESQPENIFATIEKQTSNIKKNLKTPTVRSNLTLKTDVKFSDSFFVVPNDVIDVLAPLQTPTEEAVYRRLFRLSYGWKRNYCRISIPFLTKTSMIKSENTIRRALKGLIEKGHIAEYINENGRIDTNNDGTLYVIFLPEEIDDLPTSGSFFDKNISSEGNTKYKGGLNNIPPQKLGGVKL